MKTVSIMFRGLLVFHQRTDHMEIGVLDAAGHEGAAAAAHPAHVPRIITTKNGVISSIFDLRNRRELGPRGQPGHVRNWEIEVTNPLQPGVNTYTRGDEFTRVTHPYAKDFRWITNLEGPDLHNRDLADELDTEGKLLIVLEMSHGEFYTQQLSKRLIRRNANNPPEPTPFGMAAEVIGCDISLEVGEVRLKAGNTTIFNFNESVQDGVVYEFSNAPPDVPTHRPPYQAGPGHFSLYYTHMFRDPLPDDQFRLVPEGDVAPAPDPALCGATLVGERDPDNPL